MQNFLKRLFISNLAVALTVVMSTAYAQNYLKRHAKMPKFQNKKALINKESLKHIPQKYLSWGINPKFNKSNIKLVSALKGFKKQKDVVVAVVDTGVDPNHPFIKDNLYVKEGKVSAKNFGKDFSYKSTNENAPHDSHGHGTHVAGIIKSVFPSAKLLIVKYFNPTASGQTNLDSTIKALDYAVKMNVDIINYSGGGPEASLAERKILKKAQDKGILVVAAAGNEQSNIDIKENAYYPASYRLQNTITVMAHNQDLKQISSSNWGGQSVDLSAPGFKIKSSLPRDRSSYMTGTSQATAFVSGVAALLKSQYPDLTATEIKKIINESASKIKTLAKKSITGGILNAKKAMALGKRVIKQKIAKRKLASSKKLALKNKNKEQKQERYFEVAPAR